MTLQEVFKVVDQLTEIERDQLRKYLEERKTPPHLLPSEERIRRLEEAAKAIREGFTDAEWETIEKDMNEEYIEPWDESEWAE